MLIDPQSSRPSADDRPEGTANDYPENPILVRVLRGERVESVHRGAWALVDVEGGLLEGRGATDFPIFARSSTKALQALPLIESGAADQLCFTTEELALALASHFGEDCHTRVVAGLLGRLGLGPQDLRCGSHRPLSHDVSFDLRRQGHEPSTLHNNCSGKHAGFLALAQYLGEPTASYIDPESRSQRLIRETVLDMTGCSEEELSIAVDGCSAPTFRLSLERLARGFARFANPHGLEPDRRAACERLAEAAAAHPELIGSTRNQICSAIARVTQGRLFPKIGAEAVYVIGERGGDRALAIKMDDGNKRGLHALILHLLRRFSLANEQELAELSTWDAGPLKNYAGLEVGRMEVL
jgi:L-asparaginase II